MATLHRAVSSQPSVLSQDAVRRWLVGLRWPDAERDDLLLAVTEAVSNAGEHAYRGAPGAITVSGRHQLTRAGLRRVEITVADHGHWRPVRHCHAPRGQGLGLMRELTASVRIDAEPGGTRVRLTSRPVPRLGGGSYGGL
jgi:anti-sigma regulatory factor (Ser/Thr protein kinase)